MPSPSNDSRSAATRKTLAVQVPLPFKRKSKGRAVRYTEKIVEAESDFELARRGYHFLNTTVRYQFFTVQCPHCHRSHKVRPTVGTGQDRGIADRLVYHPRWWHPLLPATLWLCVELKGSHTPYSSPEQGQLAEDGHTLISRSGEATAGFARQVDHYFRYVALLEARAFLLVQAVRSKRIGLAMAAADNVEALMARYDVVPHAGTLAAQIASNEAKSLPEKSDTVPLALPAEEESIS